VLWLAETRGWPAVAELYGNAGDFERTYGTSLAELEEEWLAFLRAIPLREQDIEAQAQRFEKASVFRRPCAHKAAELLRESARAQLHGRRDEALELQRNLCKIEPEDPNHVLRLASMHASFGEFDTAAALLDELATRDNLTSTTEAIIAEQRGDTALLDGELSVAANHYEAAMQRGLTEARRRQLQIKLSATKDSELAPLIADYFDPFGGDDDSEAGAILKLWTAKQIAELPGHQALGNYLLGRQFLIIAAPEQAAEVLGLALAPTPGEPKLPSPEIERAALLSQVSALTQLQAWDYARALLDRLDALAEGEGHRQEVAEWRERIEFFAEWFAEEDA
jgi:hypothetical protein